LLTAYPIPRRIKKGKERKKRRNEKKRNKIGF
jgi:hypothetical protein